MSSSSKAPWVATLFAAVAAAAMVAYGVPIPMAVAVLLLWSGSLWLVVQRAPPIAGSTAPKPLNEAQMGDLFELSEVPVIVTRRDRVTVANAAARARFGEHLLAQDIRIALRHPSAVALIENPDSEGATVSGLVQRRDVWRINRKMLPGEVAVYELVNRTAEADISRAHTDFVANASHELRTPLASIIGYVETLRDDDGGVDEDTRGRFLSIIEREAKRLQALVSDLMSLSRIEAEKHDVPTDELDLSALVERAARDAAGEANIQRLALSVASGITACGDAQQLEQLVRNLVDNAFKYGSTHEQIDVELAPIATGRIELTVRDRGDGIPPEHLPHLTRRFYRTDPGRSRASGGTGLGLAIVKHIVERHRGKLEIASAPGKGTVVTVRLRSTPD